MKKFTFLFSIITSIAFVSNGQAFKYPLFEHFTQASCGPCAAQNPGFQATILDPNPNTVRHIAYHTSWPGVDPMYNYNQTESNDRVDYYGVTGVPDIFLEGNYKHSQPGGMTMDDVNFIIAQTSPVKITVSDVDNGSSHDVTVNVISVGMPPTGSFVLRTAIIERNINYTTPPGNNGEKYFPNVFRKMLPSSDGDAITLPAQGGTVTFTYTYNEDAAWVQSEIGVVSFVQKSTKEVINCGASFDNVVNAIITQPTVLSQKGIIGVASNFDFSTGNSGTAAEDFTYSLTSDAPVDWSGSFTVNGVSFSNSGTVTIPANTSFNTSIAVTPGATPAFAQYTLTIQSLTNPNSAAMLTSVYVISGITDLIVNAGGGLGDGTGGGPADWQSYFDAGLSNAGSTTYTVAAYTKAMQGFKDNILT
ncbi:MAG: Omp28-related outer membrane protein, partial [Chitinophagales bacterium]|nr:Omp28-related outer membrane protein [Chitinophagales bacterium]